MPRPGWALIVTSIVFIGACLFFGGVALAGFVHWDPCVWFAAIIFGGPLIALAVCQYLATFRAVQSSARVLYFSLLLGACGFLVAGIGVVEPVVNGIMPTYDYLILPILMFVLFGAGFCWVGLVNLWWHRELIGAATLATRVDDGNAATSSRGRFRITLRECLALIAAVSVAFAGASFGARDISPQVATHVSPQAAGLDLPAGATDVCVWRGYRGTITYNFAIDEAGFWEWAKSIRGSLEAQTSGVTIQPVTEHCAIRDPSADDGTHRFSRGWVYSWHKEDRGLRYAYDADLGRAYYSSHSH